MKPRRWFRFGLRTLFVLLTIFGVWLGVQVKWIRDRREALDGITYVREETNAVAPAPMSLRVLGERGVSWIWLQQSDLKPKYKKLFPEAQVEADESE